MRRLGGGGDDGPAPITRQDRAVTFGEGAVSVGTTKTEVSNETVSLTQTTLGENSVSLPPDAQRNTSISFSEDYDSVTLVFDNTTGSFENLDVNGQDSGLGSGDINLVGNVGTANLDLTPYTAPYDLFFEFFNRSNFDRSGSIAVEAPAFSGQATIEWTYPNDVIEWDVAAFQTSPDGETVEVYIQESTDGGSTWTEIQGPIIRGQKIQAGPESRVRYRVELSRSDLSNNPTFDAAYRRWIV